jgi:ubiquitin C-terminal hydrolase
MYGESASDWNVAMPLNPQLMSGTHKYQLFAVVNHHGTSTDGGHYTAHVKQASGKWLWIDDAAIQNVSLAEVLSEKKEYQPYILFYM